MKDFFKMLLAVIVGFFVTGVLCMFLFFVSIAGMVAAMGSADQAAEIPEHSVLKIQFNGALVERTINDPAEELLQKLSNPSAKDTKKTSLSELIKAVNLAKTNDHIDAIFIDIKSLSSGIASLEELRNALVDFKESKKPIYCYADSYSQGAYYLASVANELSVNPQGSVAWKGLSATIMYLKDVYEKIGVKMNVFKVGDFKSAVEPFTRTNMSEPNKLQTNVFLSEIWTDFKEAVSTQRGMSCKTLDSLANTGIFMKSAKDLLACHMVDTLVYRGDLKEYIRSRMGLHDKDKKLHMSSPYDVAHQKVQELDMSGQVIAVYYAVGGIDNGSAGIGDEGINSEKVVRDLRKLEKDDDVKAVVLRINSPGGSAYGSEQMWRAISRLKAEKPVIVSMGNYAASGGYYISCNASYIVAQPTTLTGSIGIFGLVPSAEVLSHKVGLHFDGVKTNEYADFGGMATLAQGMNAQEKMMIQSAINRGYELFTSRCAEGRGMSLDSLKAIASGRVWTGAKAKEIGLVDELGGLQTAIKIAAKKADIEKYAVVNYPAKKTMIESLLDDGPYSLVEKYIEKAQLGSFYSIYAQIKSVGEIEPIQARLPMNMTIE